jgi:dTDP-4-dehydrorhamnose reductase
MVNSILPIQLAFLSRKSGYRVIHFSTNAVFSGNNRRNTERTLPFPRTKYGFTKLLGDFSAFSNLIIRTSFVGVPPIGTGSTGLVSKCKSAKLNDVIIVNDNYSWNGLTIDALIQLILAIIRETKINSGIFHVGTSISLSREELIKLILLRIERSDLLVKVEDKGTPKNMSLETVKVSTVSSWWAKTEYRTIPNLTDLLTEAKFN